MKFLDTDIPALGMGCWPIGGAFYADDQPLGYANADDAESLRTLDAAYDHGIRLFDTAAVYGAGHSERLIGQALSKRPEALIVTKIGIAFDEATKRVSWEAPKPEDVEPAIERCLTRLQRDRIDVVLLHANELPIYTALPIFEAMEAARVAGKIRSYGWSTDFPDRVAAIAPLPGCVAVEHAMNVFTDVPTIQQTVRDHGLTALIRSPLAMGILTGKFDGTTVFGAEDNRSSNDEWRDYFVDGKVAPEYLARLAAVRELLQSGGRTMVQGALCWLWAKGAENLPVPGARTVAQIEGSAGALAHGPLPQSVMEEIEAVLQRPEEGPARAR